MSVVGSVKDSIKSGEKKYLPRPRSQPQAQYSDYTDKIGSMALRAHHMNYSRAILNSNWWVQASADGNSLCIYFSHTNRTARVGMRIP